MRQFIQTYQTLIVGIVGFAGVIITLIVNAYLDRRRHTRQVEHDARVLRVAIRAELEAIRDTLQDRLAMFESMKAPGGTSDFMPPLAEAMTDAYGSLIERLGLLSEHEIRAVMRAYLPIRQMPETMKLLALSRLTEFERERQFAESNGEYALALRAINEDYLQRIQTALSVISV
jgi:hypothetical protein